ncbi:MAG: phenylalanine--tRNA ligase subunit alpha [Patescibacteria group bacterium]|nr:phenylalanine--tRNA ligase subunit alpha [Patescibacteria group bacterium]
MKTNLNKIKKDVLELVNQAKDLKSLEKIETQFLGRKDGEITKILRGLKKLTVKQKKEIGPLANALKKEIKEMLKEKKNNLVGKRTDRGFDYTLPPKKPEVGHLHPITQFTKKVTDVFVSMGFEIVDGPEVETEEYNFDLLNIPAEHPSRDMWDTYYIKKSRNEALPRLLRTHTSSVQLRAMEKRKPPVRLIVPGRVFRHEAVDAGHETNFYQCEGLVIDENVSMANLISTLRVFVKKIFGEKAKIRVRPSYFPFVEPGIEVDMSCLICDSKGCSACKQTGWLEMLGAGMVHPKVLENMKVDSKKYTGFAFGLGIDRFMMLYYGINDIRLSYNGDLRFIKQF